MTLVIMANEFGRNVVDHSFSRDKALPAGGETNYLDSYVTDGVTTYLPIDLAEYHDRTVLDSVEVELAIDACPNLAAGKSVVFTLLESDAEQGPFAALAASHRLKITGAADIGGSPERVTRFRLPEDVRRYLLVEQIADADCGDLTEARAWLRLLF
jgi:hypothetical protein